MTNEAKNASLADLKYSLTYRVIPWLLGHFQSDPSLSNFISLCCLEWEEEKSGASCESPDQNTGCEASTVA